MTGSARAGRDPRVAVFVSSSDNTVDVLQRVFPALERFWPDCPYRTYVGLNAQPNPLAAAEAVRADVSEWRTELAVQLRLIPQEWIILTLDDFLLQARVDQGQLGRLVERCLQQRWPYLRLIPLEGALLARWLRRLTSRRGGMVQVVPRRYPYYSALQIAVWHKPHLLELLESARDIWSFEHMEPINAVHRAVVARALKYRHLVEKGRWLPDAAALLAQAGLAAELGKRESWPVEMYWRQRIGRWRFQLTGYAPMKLKRRLRAAQRGGSPDTGLR